MQLDIVPNNNYVEVLNERKLVDTMQEQLSPFLMSLGVGKRTLQAYKTNVGYFIHWVIDNDVTIRCAEDLHAYKKYLTDKVLKASTINAYLTAVRRFFNWLYIKDFIPTDWAKHLKSEKVDNEHKKDPLTDDQWARLMDNIDLSKPLDMRDYIILLLGANYGLRSIEISRLNKSDIIEVQGKYALNLWRKGYSEADKKARPISDDFAELLFNFVGTELDDTPIFTSLSNNASSVQSERLSTSGIRYSIHKRFVEAGITSKRVSFHSLRHTAATKLIKMGKSMLSVRDFMDHKSVTTTEIYVATASRFDDPIAFDLDMMKPTHTNTN